MPKARDPNQLDSTSSAESLEAKATMTRLAQLGICPVLHNNQLNQIHQLSIGELISVPVTPDTDAAVLVSELVDVTQSLMEVLTWNLPNESCLYPQKIPMTEEILQLVEVLDLETGSSPLTIGQRTITEDSECLAPLLALSISAFSRRLRLKLAPLICKDTGKPSRELVRLSARCSEVIAGLLPNDQNKISKLPSIVANLNHVINETNDSDSKSMASSQNSDKVTNYYVTCPECDYEFFVL